MLPFPRSLRTSKTSPATTGWFQVFPSIARIRASSVNRSEVAFHQRQLALLRQQQRVHYPAVQAGEH